MRSSDRRATLLAAILAVVGAAGAARAGDEDKGEGDAPKADKSVFTLFDPTPTDKLRAFNPDRPGQSHDPTTIDAGHLAVELNGFEHVFDPHGPSTTRRSIWGDPALRLGLTDWLEVQAQTPFGNLYRSGPGPDGTIGHGIGDTVAGFKANLLGNDGGEHQLALLPLVKLPTAAHGIGNDHVEFNVSAPYNYNITKELALTLEPSAGLFRTTSNTRYRDGYGFIAGLDQMFAKVFIASIEVSTTTTTARKEPTTWAWSPSLAYFVTPNIQLDVGATFGLNKATPRYDPSVGISARF